MIKPVAVPKVRAPQTQILLTCSRQFLQEFNAALKKNHVNNRNQFIRDAIAEKLKIDLGIDLPREIVQPPIRVQDSAVYPEHPSRAYQLNEEPERTERPDTKAIALGMAQSFLQKKEKGKIP